jgi:DNA-binding CsgD family transcriptional regulator
MPRPRKNRLLPSITLYTEELVRTLSQSFGHHVAEATDALTAELKDLGRDLKRLQRRLQTLPTGAPIVDRPSRSGDPLGPLTEREREICFELLSGARNPDIARRYGLSIRTVETHRAHILKKLNRSSLAELIIFASEAGILPRRQAAPVAALESRRARTVAARRGPARRGPGRRGPGRPRKKR